MFSKKILLVLILFFSFFHNVFAADLPVKYISGLNNCTYLISGYDFTGTSYNSGTIPISCNGSIPVSSLKDGIYKINLSSKDKTTIPGANVSNFETITYKVDTKPIVCSLEELTLKGINNQYYNNGKLYYKSSTDAKGTIKLKITCKDTQTPGKLCFGASCVSGISEVIFPQILGKYPSKIVHNPTLEQQTYNITYDWKGKYIDTVDIINNGGFIATDGAGNITKTLLGSNTKVIFQNDMGIQIGILTGISSLILTPDGIAPLVNDTSIDYITNKFYKYGFKYKPGNIGNGVYSNIYISDDEVKYMSALNNRSIQIPKFSDSLSGVRGYKVEIEDSDNKSFFNTPINESYGLTRITTISSKEFLYNFSDVSKKGDYNSGIRNYNFDFYSIKGDGAMELDKICDMVGNCVSFLTPEFKIIANEPDINKTTNNLVAELSGNVGNGVNTYNVEANFKDKYDNEIVAISGIKQVKISTNFTNTMGVDQTNTTGINKGDGVAFKFYDGNSSINVLATNNYSDFNYSVNNFTDLNLGTYKFNIASYIPTYNEYLTSSSNPISPLKSIYGTNPNQANLKLNKIGIQTNNLLPYSGIGERGELNIADTATKKTNFKWKPIVNFDSISPIFPLVEGQVKKLNISNYRYLSNDLKDYYLKINVGTNNDFLKITKTNLETGNKNDGKDSYNIVANNSFYKFGDDYGIIGNNNTNEGVINILPQTIGGIEDDNTLIALSSVLEYKLGLKNVKLPGIQTGFKDFGYHPVTDFALSAKYSENSTIIFSQIDIAGITQTNNFGTNEGAGATTTDGATTKFDDFSNITLLDLKTDINKNVYDLLKGYDMNNGKVLSGQKTISNLKNNFTGNDGIITQNGSVIYFKDTDVTLNCTSSCEISGKKTIIIENGNLTINSNMYYSDDKSILGIILIGNTSSGNKSQLRIKENITNGVGIVYSEGPVVSVNNSGIIYNGLNVGENLINQLYWKGSFITRNTIGGAISSINGTCPYGTPHYEDGCTKDTAQAYDLIYLRRYARVSESYYGTSNDPMLDGKVPLHYDTKDIKISGNRVITKNGSMNLGDTNLIKSNNYNAPLIIEYDSRMQSLIPYGFEK